jgi:glycogen(starch) synthase
MEIRKINAKKPKLALLLDTWYPYDTGQETYLAKLAEHLIRNEGYEVDILTRPIKGVLTKDESAFENTPGLTVKRFGLSSKAKNIFWRFFYIVYTFFYLSIFGKRYELVHAHSASAAIPMKFASWINGVPTLLTVHGHQVFSPNWTLKKVLHRIVFLETKYTQEITVSEPFLKAKNVNEQVLLIPGGIDTAPFDAISMERDPSRFTVLFVGPLEYSKGVDLLIQATKLLVEDPEFGQNHREFTVHIVGQGPEEVALKRMVAQLGLNSYVKFYGKMKEETLFTFYKAADLFVLPARTDGLPLSLLRACAARLPILASDVGDFRKVVLENTNGHLTHPGDIDELAFYLKHFAVNPHLERMGQASYELVTQEYDWDLCVRKNIRVYEGLAQEVKSRTFMPWHLPKVLWLHRRFKKTSLKKSPLRFCFTVRLEQAPGAQLLPHELEEVPGFLERLSEFCSAQEMPSTVFVERDLFEPFRAEIQMLHELGHELGIQLLGSEWLATSPTRRKAIRTSREQLNTLGLNELAFFKVKGEVDADDLDYAHQHDLDFLAPSEDPLPRLYTKYGLPFAHIQIMNLKTFVESSEEDLLAAVNRLKILHQQNKVMPFLIFECSSWEFFSQEGLPYTGGKNFTELSKKLAFLRSHMDIDFLTLSEFRKLCKL